MPIEIRMPRLVDTMTQGAVVAWRKKEGERVRAGEVIAEIEADKATVDLEAPGDGTLARIIVPVGAEKVEVGRVLAVLDEIGQMAPASNDQPSAAPPPVSDGDEVQPASRPSRSLRWPEAWPGRPGSRFSRYRAAVRRVASSWRM